MIKPEQIPKEVVEAIQICTGMSDAAARGLAIIMLEQWPNHNIVDDDVVYVDRAIMLPLPTEKTNDQA